MRLAVNRDANRIFELVLFAEGTGDDTVEREFFERVSGGSVEVADYGNALIIRPSKEDKSHAPEK